MKKLLGIVVLGLFLITNAQSDIIDSIKKLNELYQSGALTKEEFSYAKKKLLDADENTSTKIIKKTNYHELLYWPNDTKISEWERFKKSSSDYNVWVEIRNKRTSAWSFQWAGDNTLKQALKRAFDVCNKRVKDRPKRDFKKSDLCIPMFVNSSILGEKARKTTKEEKIKYTEEYYGKKKSDKFFKRNSWALE